jgi:hypothetical protein
MSADHALTRPIRLLRFALSLISHHSIKINEDNNKDTTAKGFSCQFSRVPYLPSMPI